MKHFKNTYIVGLTSTKTQKVQDRTTTVNNSKCTLQKAKPREIKYKILKKENEIWRIIPGHLTVKWKGKDTICNNN